MRLRQNKYWANAKLWFIPENNLGLEAAHLHTMMGEFKEVETYWQKPDRPGVHKDGKATRGYQYLMNNALSQRGVKFDADMFTISREQTVDSQKATLREQMERYHWEKKAAVDNFGKDRFAITAKMGSLQDDLLIATLMVLYWGRAIIRNPTSSQ